MTPAAFYESLLSDARRAGVHHLPHGPLDHLLAGAAGAGCLVRRIDLAAARDKAGMLAAVARGLEFPDWFGHNWDALADCLADLEWLPAPGYLVVLEHCDGVHASAEGDFVTLLQAFQEAAESWREEGVAFWCLVDMLADGIAWLPTIAQPGEA